MRVQKIMHVATGSTAVLQHPLLAVLAGPFELMMCTWPLLQGHGQQQHHRQPAQRVELHDCFTIPVSAWIHV